MTVKEKQLRLKELCDRHAPLCTSNGECPLYHCEDHHLTCCSEYPPEIEALYELAFGTTEAVDHPAHYNQGGIECIDAMIAAFGKEAVKNFCLVNAFKYVWRARDKNGMEDIDKSIWYLNKFKELNASE